MLKKYTERYYTFRKREWELPHLEYQDAKTASGDEILIRTVLVPETVRSVSAPSEKMTVAELLSMATERRIARLVEICRTLSPDLGEEPTTTYKGAFRYWFKGKMVFGVNVAGGRYRPPLGELDVWIPVTRFPEVAPVTEEHLREVLKRDFAATDSGVTDCVVRLTSPEKAQALVSLVRGWVRTPVPSPSAAQSVGQA